MEEKDGLQNVLRNTFLIAIIFSVVFAFVFGYTGILMKNGNTCGRDTFTDYRNKELSNSSYVLDNSTDYVLQTFSYNSTDYLKFKFCYEITVNGVNGAVMQVTDGQNVLAQQYLTTGQAAYCADINISDTQNIGLKCLNCESNNTVTLLKELGGVNTKQVFNNEDSLTITEDTTLSYKLLGYKSCNKTLRFFILLYVGFLFGVFLIALIIVGFKKFASLLFEGW